MLINNWLFKRIHEVNDDSLFIPFAVLAKEIDVCNTHLS